MTASAESASGTFTKILTMGGYASMTEANTVLIGRNIQTLATSLRKGVSR